MADDLIAGLVIQVGVDLSELEAGITQATADLQTLGASVEELSGQASVLGSSMAEVSSAAAEVGSATGELGTEAAAAGAEFGGLHDALNETTATANETKDSAGGLTEAFAGLAGAEGVGGLTEKLGELAGALGISLGLGDLAKDALETYANVQKAEISLTALTGSAATATATIDQLKDMAMQDALSFPTLLQADQRMIAFGFDADKIPSVLQGVADAAAATDRDFGSVANAVDRMVLSGAVAARQLATLGLSFQDIGAAMGMAEGSTKEITAAFKDLDQSGRIDVMVTALQKYQGVAAQVAAGLSGQWQDLKNQVDFTLEDIGAKLSPLASAAMSVFSVVLDAAHAAVTGFAELDDAVGKLDVYFHSTSSDIGGYATIVSAAFSVLAANLGITTSTMNTSALASKYLQDSMRSAADAAMAHATAADAVTTAHVKTKAAVSDTAAALAAVSDQANATVFQFHALDDSTNALDADTQQLNDDWLQCEPTLSDIQDQISAAASQIDISDSATARWTSDIESLAFMTGQGTDALANLAQQVGTVTEQTDTLDAATKELNDDWMLCSDTAVTINTHIGTLNTSMGGLGRTGQSLGKQLDQTFSGDVATAITDTITGTKNLGAAFEKIGTDIVKVVLDNIIKQALAPLAAQLSSIIGQVTGLGGAFGQLGSSGAGGGGILGTGLGGLGGGSPTDLGGLPGVGGAPGTDLGTGAGAGGAGGLGSLLSSITGIVGALGSIAGAIGTFIEGGAMNDKLFKIEQNTRYASIDIKTIIAWEQSSQAILWLIRNEAFAGWQAIESLTGINATLGSTVTAQTQMNTLLDAIRVSVLPGGDLWNVADGIWKDADNLLKDFNSFAVQLLAAVKTGGLGTGSPATPGAGGTPPGAPTTGSPTTPPTPPPTIDYNAAAAASAAVTNAESAAALEAMKKLADIMASNLSGNPSGMLLQLGQLQPLLATTGLTPDQLNEIKMDISAISANLASIAPNAGTLGSTTVNLLVDGQTLSSAVVNYLEGSGTKT